MSLCTHSSGNIVLAVALLFAGAIYIFFSSRSVSDPTFVFQNNVDTLRRTEYPVDDLEAALDSAATGNNRTVIIAMVNKAYVAEVGGGRTMFDLFLESFREGERHCAASKPSDGGGTGSNGLRSLPLQEAPLLQDGH
ncbi:hypothetical protein V5N11_019241 [Cardamine amara subsp. amara]|uniref:TPM domain-containing protein n=1 Tax=Cardamine amara subsp. amara TaxID=228776 RepID=A0ABD1B7H4_CARAN